MGPKGIPDDAVFWIDGNKNSCHSDNTVSQHLSTDQITVINGHVHRAQCFDLGRKII